MSRRPPLCLLAAVLLAAGASAHAQGSLDVTFRFLPDLTPPPIEPVVRAFVPGSFNDWGQPYTPGTGSCIMTGDESQATYDAGEDEYRYTRALQIGQTYTYKVQYHRDTNGTDCVWLSDPLNLIVTGPNNDSVVEVADPMAFQLARERDESNRVVAVSAGLFGTEAFTSIQFYVNEGPAQDGLPYYDPATGIFRYELPVPVAAPGYFRLAATDDAGRTVDEAVGLLPPPVTDLPRPAGLQDGITYVDGATVRLSLFAPFKGFVHVLGDFNGWAVSDDDVLYRDAAGEDPATADSVWWWIELDGLTPGEDYRFQYLVDGELRLADPYSEQVLLPDDASIPASAYPDLVPYPEAEAAGAPVTLLQPGRLPYDWQHDDYARPAQEDLVVYELLVRDFLAAHDYDTLADTLDYLDRLGVNAIELMPVAEFGGNVNWGYQPLFHLALDKYYGPPEQFKAFVDAAHARGIAVLLDVVYNHADAPSPLVVLYGCTEASPYTNNPARHPFNVFCDLDHTYPGTQHWLDRANRYWIEEYHVDGYRFDLAGGFMQTGPFIGYNPERIALLERMMGALWSRHPDAFVVIENLIENEQEWAELAQYGLGQGWPGPLQWHNMNRAYSQSAMGYLSDAAFSSDLRDTYPPNWVSGMPVTGAVTYMESHDEQWLMYRNIAYGPQQGDYDVGTLPTALDRQKLVGTFFFTVPGPRMLWQFGELGYGWGDAGEQCLEGAGDDCPPIAPGRTDPKPIRWDYQDDWRRLNLYKVYEALLRLRADYAVFTSPDTEVEMEVGQGDPTRWIKLALADAPAGEPDEVVVVGNFGLEPLEVAPGFPRTGTWYEFFSDTALEVTGPEVPIPLLPGQAALYTAVDVPSPEPGIYAVDDEGAPAAPAAFRLDGAYPNPVTGAATLAFAVPEAGDVRLEVFDVLGRRVAVLVDERRPAGEHRVAWNAAGLPGGVYVARLSSAGRAAATKLTLTR